MDRIITGLETRMAVAQIRMDMLTLSSTFKIYGPEIKKLREDIETLRDSHLHLTI